MESANTEVGEASRPGASAWIGKVEQELKELAQGTDEARASAFYKAYLETASRFWRYSVYNQLLILQQRPEASRVAGFRAWWRFNRSVKKGERGIRILAPVLRKAAALDESDEEAVVRGFFPVCVFDMSQTEGEPLPELDVVATGDEHEALLEQLVRLCESLGVRVDVAPLSPGLFGVSKGGVIVIDAGQSVNGRAAILLHELAHELLHKDGEPLGRAVQEIQAEGVAFVVGRALGLETKSFDYLALYNADAEKIMANLKAIASASRTILGGLALET